MGTVGRIAGMDGHAVLTCAQMAAADRATIENGAATGIALMQRAGKAVADCVRDMAADRHGVDIVCGPGNNGGDGYVAARLLHEAGIDVRLFALSAPRDGSDAALAANEWAGPVHPLSVFAPSADRLVVDALFGAGFRDALPGDVVSVFKAIADAGCAVVAVDVPSGMDGDTGHCAGAPDCVATVTFHRHKPAHLLAGSARKCGMIICADIGIVSSGLDAVTWRNVPDLWRHALPKADGDTHKYQRGHVAVFSGSEFSSGAARLSAMAAARAGAGAVTLLGSADALRVHAAHVTAIMLQKIGHDDALAGALAGLNRVRALVIGPGFGRAPLVRTSLPGLLSGFSGVSVLDADALTAFEAAPDALFGAIAASDGQGVLTPHAGEFARLFPDIAADQALGKVQQARLAAKRAHAVVLYKGPDTVIAHPDGRAVISTHGTPALATAGSGDVLAGIIAGLAAQGMEAFEAACAAAWLHAQAGRLAGSFAVAEDLVGAVPHALREICETALDDGPSGTM